MLSAVGTIEKDFVFERPDFSCNFICLIRAYPRYPFHPCPILVPFVFSWANFLSQILAWRCSKYGTKFIFTSRYKMTFRKAGIISGAFAVAAIGFSLLGSAGAQQIGMRTDSLTMTGIFNEDYMTGSFTKGAEGAETSWHVFVGGDGKIYKARIESERIAELYRDGAPVSDSEAGQYSSATANFLRNLKLQHEMDQEEATLELREKDLEEQEEAIDKERDELDRRIERMERRSEKSETYLSAAREELEKSRQKMDAASRELELRNKEIEVAQKRLDERRDAMPDSLDGLFKVLDSIIADLRADGLVKNKNGVSFKLSNRQFVVNGKAVTGDVYDRYRQKYLIQTAAESGFVYNWKGKV